VEDDIAIEVPEEGEAQDCMYTAPIPSAIDYWQSNMADENSEKGSAPSTSSFDPMMMYTMGDSSSLPNQNMFPITPPLCACNGTTGPCARHLEDMRHRWMQPRTSSGLNAPMQMPTDNDRMMEGNMIGNEYFRHMQGIPQAQMMPMSLPSSGG
jgi:hypothetical protein